MSTSHSWSRRTTAPGLAAASYENPNLLRSQALPGNMNRLAGLLLLELLLLASPGCGSLLAFTPERAAVEALLGPADRTGRPENIVSGSVKVQQIQAWRDASIVLITFNATEPEIGLVDCLYLFRVTRVRSRWVTDQDGQGCWTTGGSGELFQISLNQSWGSEDPGMSWAYGLVYDGRVAALDFLWEDGEMETIAVIQGTFLAMRTGVHEMVLVRPLDTNGDLVK